MITEKNAASSGIHLERIIPCFRTADLRYRSLSYMLTGMMSGIRRNRRSERFRKGYEYQEL